jgi:hypothetical protein
MDLQFTCETGDGPQSVAFSIALIRKKTVCVLFMDAPSRHDATSIYAKAQHLALGQPMRCEASLQ